MKTAHPLALVIALGSSACGSTVSVAPDPGEEGVVIPEASTEAAWTVIEDTVGNDWPREVTVGDGGRIWVTGRVDAADGGHAMWLLGLDGEGNEVARDAVSGGYASGETVTALGDGVVLQGSVDEVSVLRRYDGAGELLWDRRFDEDVRAVVAAPTGGLVLTGAAAPEEGSGEEAVGWLASVSDEGELLWSSTVQGAGLYGAAFDGDGRLHTVTFDAPTETAALERRSADGELLSTRALDCGGLFALGVDGAIATADAGELVGEPSLCLHDAALDRRWRVEVERPGAVHVGVQGLTIDPFGRVVASGFAVYEDEHSEMWVHTYDEDGTLAGEHSWGGPDDVFGYGFSVASDAEGALVTNGIVIGEGLSKYAIAVRKLVPSGG